MADVTFPVTQHFAIEEFACRDGTPYPVGNVDDEDPAGRTWLQSRLLPLCEVLEAVRAAVGGPVVVDSGYRTLAYDQRIYAADRGRGNVAKPQGSQHPKGRAADVRVPGMTPEMLYRIVMSEYGAGRLPRLGGLGLYPTFVHLDVRVRPGSTGGANGGHLAVWGGTRDAN